MRKKEGESKLSSNSKFNYKQVIVLRTDLSMSTGKIAAQASHAAVSTAEITKKTHFSWWKSWIKEGQPKIILKVNSKEKILKLTNEVKAMNLPYKLISDMGLTEILPGTITCLGIGPAPVQIIDKITRKLPLL